MRFRITLVCLVILFSSHVSTAAQKEWKTLVLPAAIDTKQEIKLTPPGWVALTDGGPHYVSGITVYDGRPETKASLVPDSEEKQKAKKRLVLKWHLTPSTTEGIWLTVSYSATSILIARQLPQGTTELRVAHDTSVTVDGLNEIVSVEYR